MKHTNPLAAMKADAAACNAAMRRNLGSPSGGWKDETAKDTVKDRVSRVVGPEPQTVMQIANAAGANEQGARHALRRLEFEGYVAPGPKVKIVTGGMAKTYRRARA